MINKLAVAYYRVSTDKQGEKGLGMQAQEAAVARHIEFNGLDLIDSFTEVESGANCERTEFARAKQKCIETGATLLIAKLDRLARNVVFIGQLLEQQDFHFIAIDMPNAGKFEMHIRAALAEEERDLISKRTKEALARSNKPLGAANPVIKAKAQEALRIKTRAFIAEYKPLVQHLKFTGADLNYSAIARQLNEQGRKTIRGCNWGYVSVKRLFEAVDNDCKAI